MTVTGLRRTRGTAGPTWPRGYRPPRWRQCAYERGLRCPTLLLPRGGVVGSGSNIGASQLVALAVRHAATAWTFVTHDGERRRVPLHSRMTGSTADAAIAASIFYLGLTRVLSYQVADALHEGRLVRVLADDEPEAAPASLIYPGQGRLPGCQ